VPQCCSDHVVNASSVVARYVILFGQYVSLEFAARICRMLRGRL